MDEASNSGLRAAFRSGEARGRFVGGLARTCVGASIALAASCGGSNDRASARTIDDSRVVSRAGIDFEHGGSTAERFGMGTRPDPHSGSSGMGASSSSKTAESPSPFAWTLPSGWTELPPSAMRQANFRPAGDPHAECYLTLLAGDAGGLGANVNRWRAQLSLPPLPPAGIEALEKHDFLGRDAVLVEASGTWKSMSGTESNPGWGLAGLLLVGPEGSAFLKMTGPEKLVAAERASFLALAKSIHPASVAAPAGPDEKPGIHGDVIAGEPPAPPINPVAQASDFTYAVPEGWRRAPDRPMRKVSFFAGSGEDLECYVTVFPGEAGGILANVNRWRGQLDAPAVTESDLATFQRIPMLGREAILVECSGKGSELVGAACQGSDRSVFVKMSGPPALVREQRTAFLAFCASLRSGK